jgi:hypothetical protein
MFLEVIRKRRRVKRKRRRVKRKREERERDGVYLC